MGQSTESTEISLSMELVDNKKNVEYCQPYLLGVKPKQPDS